MKLVRVVLNLPENEYNDALDIANSRGVSFTDAIRGFIYTEKFLRDKANQGYSVRLVSNNDGKELEVKFHNVRETKI